jgi:magnesium-transporting ATPase (P-type)
LLLNGNTVEIQEIPLTVESNRIRKIIFAEVYKEIEELIAHNKPLEKLSSSLIFSGTKCVKGSGDLLALRVGNNSEIGKIECRIAAEDGINTLEENLDKLDGDIGKFGMLDPVITLTAFLLRFGIPFNANKVKYDAYFQQKQTAQIQL